MAPRKESQKPRGGDADEEKKKRDYTAQLRPAGLVKSAADSTSESTDKRGKRGRRESFDDPEYKPSAKGKVKTSKKRKVSTSTSSGGGLPVESLIVDLKILADTRAGPEVVTSERRDSAVL